MKNSKNIFLMQNGSKICLGLSAFFVSFIFEGEVHAQYTFDTGALDKNSASQIANIKDLSVFAGGATIPPGDYYVELFVNNVYAETINVKFVDGKDGILIPELRKEQLLNYGLSPLASKAFEELPSDALVFPLDEYIEGAKTNFDLEKQTLSLSIPQIYIWKLPQGYVDPSLWDTGVPAVTTNYYVSGSETKYKHEGGRDRSFYFSLNNGLNFGKWWLRSNTVYNRQNNRSSWETYNTTLNRGIPEIKSLLTLGQTSTSSKIFNGFQFDGVRLASDNAMYPLGEQGFAPVVRGVANSDSKVTIRQNGYIVNQSYVAAGPFEIKDLYSTLGSGDLLVTVDGLNGNVQEFIVPFSSAPIMLREGQMRYSVSAGKFSTNLDNVKKPKFVQATIEYGLPHDITAFGGTTLSKDYMSFAGGIGLNLGGLGALSGGITHAETKVTYTGYQEEKLKGQSANIQYSKSLTDLGTNVTLGAYRYSTEDFYDFDESVYLNSRPYTENRKSRFQLTLNQSLGEKTSLNFNLYRQSFWGADRKESTAYLGLNSRYKLFSYGLGVSYSKIDKESNHSVSANLSFPLDLISYNTSITTGVNYSRGGEYNAYVGASGRLLDDGSLYYSLQQSYGNRGQGAASYGNISYSNQIGTYAAGLLAGKNSNQINYSAQGGALFYSGGLVFANNIGETTIVVDAPGTSGVQLASDPKIRTNGKGLAVMPYVNPYSRNIVELNAESFNDNVDLKATNVSVVPTRGAVVVANFATTIGYKALISATYQDKPIPFGAVARLKLSDNEYDNESAGIFNEAGEVYMTGLPKEGVMHISWGKDQSQQCLIDYQLDDPAEKNLSIVSLTCQ